MYLLVSYFFATAKRKKDFLLIFSVCIKLKAVRCLISLYMQVIAF